MDLPKKDKNGLNYLSYSQISLFKRDKTEYYKRYLLNEKFEGNDYTDFGRKVGLSLEKGDFKGFNKLEQNVLKEVTRLDEFEKRTILKYDEFYVVGFIDTCSSDLKTIIDYKTGGVNKHKQYELLSYNQLQIYALSLRQEFGVTPINGCVEFISRSGNAFRGETLKVSEKPIIKINVDLSYDRLKYVYWDVLNTATQISEFYKENK